MEDRKNKKGNLLNSFSLVSASPSHFRLFSPCTIWHASVVLEHCSWPMTNTRAQEAGRIDALFKEHEQQLTELRGTLACHDQRFDQLKTDNREMLRDFIAQQA